MGANTRMFCSSKVQDDELLGSRLLHGERKPHLWPIRTPSCCKRIVCCRQTPRCNINCPAGWFTGPTALYVGIALIAVMVTSLSTISALLAPPTYTAEAAARV